MAFREGTTAGESEYDFKCMPSWYGWNAALMMTRWSLTVAWIVATTG